MVDPRENRNGKPTPRRRARTVPTKRTGSDPARRSGSPQARRTGSTPTRRSGSAPAKRTGRANTANNRAVAIAFALIAVVFVGTLGVALAGQFGGQPPADSSGANAENAASGATSGKAQGPYSVSFATTGDLIFWREVADYIDKNGGASAMANIAEPLSQADVTISNLESPLSDDESEPIPDKDVYIIGRPSAIESVKASGIDIVSLANNHIMDYTGPALKDTLSALDGAGILHAGAGMTESEAEQVAETSVNGASIAFLSWTDVVPDNFLAYKDEPGVVSARMNMDDACKRVREAKETHDIVIVAMHWGVEYEDNITDYLQSEPAHKLVDAGADVILGNHPHVMQGIEFYKGALIAYAHGNCVFWQKYDHTHESIVLNFDITQDGVSNVVATPLYLDDTYGIPDFATDSQAQETLSRLEEISQGMNASFEIKDGKAYVTPSE